MDQKGRMVFVGTNPFNDRKCCRILCLLLLIGSLLFTGCASHRTAQNKTQQSNSTEAPKTPETTLATQLADTTASADITIPTDDSEDPSVVIFRQAMVETPRIFAAAFFGYVPQDADLFAVMQETAPQLCENLPFLLAVGDENIIGTYGYLFCIVPADENATVAVNRRPWNAETESYEEPEVLYRRESGSPILVMCPNEDWIPDTEVIITDSSENVTVWSPYLNPDYSISGLSNDNGESLIFDFTSYDELPDPGWSQGIDSSELVGTWGLTWTEVEGDRSEAEPGVCTIKITPDETDTFRFTYTNRDFSEENVQNRELIVVAGELYPDCGNNRWSAEVTNDSADNLSYALTLLEDGTLLLQTSWEMDGVPGVSYGWYCRIS